MASLWGWVKTRPGWSLITSTSRGGVEERTQGRRKKERGKNWSPPAPLRNHPLIEKIDEKKKNQRRRVLEKETRRGLSADSEAGNKQMKEDLERGCERLGGRKKNLLQHDQWDPHARARLTNYNPRVEDRRRGGRFVRPK